VPEEVFFGEFWRISLYPAVEEIPEKNNFYWKICSLHTKTVGNRLSPTSMVYSSDSFNLD
jgi:hypothetical protein